MPRSVETGGLDRASRGAKGELLFLTMEFLAGETLSQRLKRAGPIEVNAALPIAADIIAGLAACLRLNAGQRR